MRTATIEYDCEGCGTHVYGIGRITVPKSQMCGVCAWLCEFVPDPEEMMRLHLRMQRIGEPRSQDDPAIFRHRQPIGRLA